MAGEGIIAFDRLVKSFSKGNFKEGKADGSSPGSKYILEIGQTFLALILSFYDISISSSNIRNEIFEENRFPFRLWEYQFVPKNNDETFVWSKSYNFTLRIYRGKSVDFSPNILIIHVPKNDSIENCLEKKKKGIKIGRGRRRKFDKWIGSWRRVGGATFGNFFDPFHPFCSAAEFIPSARGGHRRRHHQQEEEEEDSEKIRSAGQ